MVNWKRICAALLLLLALPLGLFYRATVLSERYFRRTHAAVRVGMRAMDLPLFASAAPNEARYDSVRCAAGGGALVLRRDDWRGILESGGGFPPACRTMRVSIEGESFFSRQRAVFDVELDEKMTVARLGPMRVLVPF